MATVYCRSTDGNDADNGSTWALADATLAASVTAGGSGGRSYVSQAHAESQAAAITITVPGSIATPYEIICGNDAAEPPTATSTAGSVSTTGANGLILSGSFYVYGLTFNAGSTTNQASLSLQNTSGRQLFESCTFNLSNTHTGSTLNVGVNNTGASTYTEFRSCNMSFGATGQVFNVYGDFYWYGGAVNAGSAIPTTFLAATSRGGRAVLHGIDLSQFGSGKSLVNAATLAVTSSVWFIDCKLAASVAVTTGSFVIPGAYVYLINCDSGDTNIRYARHSYEGTVTSETTIVRSGGATDGTTAHSRKVVTGANNKYGFPLYTDWLPFWNSTIGSSITVAIPIVTDNVTLTDAQAWIEVEGQTNSGYPYGGFANDRSADILATAANQTTDSTSSWTTTGLTTPVKQVLSTTITPQEIGWIRVRVAVAKASTTMYFDPAPINGSWVKYTTKQRMHEGGVIQTEDAAAAGGVFQPFPGQ